MKEKLSKILLGISAVIAAGFLCILNSISAQAATDSLNHIDIYTFDNASQSFSQISSIPATISITAQDVPGGTETYDHSGAFIFVYPDGKVEFGFEIIYTGNVTGYNLTSTTSYSFDFNGKNFTNTVTIHNDQGFNIGMFYDTILTFDDNDSLTAFGREIENTIDNIEKAIKGMNPDGSVNADGSVYYETPGAVNNTIIKAVADAKANITLIYTYQYQGYVFQSRITPELAAKLYSENIPWCGPCYVASNCPTVMIGVA